VEILLKDVDDAQLKADVDEIMQRVKHIMEKVDALDPGRQEEDQCDEEAP
jgi:hypothetical protein